MHALGSVEMCLLMWNGIALRVVSVVLSAEASAKCTTLNVNFAVDKQLV